MKAAVPLAATVAFAGGASLLWQGPVPGDAALAAALQAAFGTQPAWAGWLTATAKAPLLFATLALGMGLAWRTTGWRPAAAVPLAYALAFVADKGLRAVLFVPRPDPALVAVTEPAASSGLPSTFGLVYGAMLGAAVLAPGGGVQGRAARLAAGVLLIAGMAARIVLGGIGRARCWPPRRSACCWPWPRSRCCAGCPWRSAPDRKEEPGGGDPVGSVRPRAARPLR
jgi:hypothetical protein